MLQTEDTRLKKCVLRWRVSFTNVNLNCKGGSRSLTVDVHYPMSPLDQLEPGEGEPDDLVHEASIFVEVAEDHAEQINLPGQIVFFN